MELTERYPALGGQEKEINSAIRLIIECCKKSGKLLLCGNGGSAADCSHIAGEFLKDFHIKRPISKEFADKLALCGVDDSVACALQEGIAAIDLTSQTAALTAIGNDISFEMAYAQLTYALARDGDVLIAISTSGNSTNVVRAAEIAKAMGLTVIAFTGERDSRLSEISTVTLRAPETDTYKVQEYHLPIYHYICLEVEKALFAN